MGLKERFKKWNKYNKKGKGKALGSRKKSFFKIGKKGWFKKMDPSSAQSKRRFGLILALLVVFVFLAFDAH